MPLRVLRAYARMMPVLQAREDLRAANVLAGAGHFRKDDLQRYRNALRRAGRSPAERDPDRKGIAELPPEIARPKLAALGISIEYVPVPAAQEPPQ